MKQGFARYKTLKTPQGLISIVCRKLRFFAGKKKKGRQNYLFIKEWTYKQAAKQQKVPPQCAHRKSCLATCLPTGHSRQDKDYVFL